MKYFEIKQRQREHGFAEMQELINTGMAWRLEGSVGREAMHLLEVGACMLPKVSFRDYYGNKIPSRDELQSGTKGTYSNAVNYYSNNN